MPRPISRFFRREVDDPSFYFDDIINGKYDEEFAAVTHENNVQWNMINAFDRVLNVVKNISKDPEKWSYCMDAMTFLKERLNMSAMQVITIAMLINYGKPMSWGMFAKDLGISRLKMMTYTEDIEALVDDFRWLCHKGAMDMGNAFEGFALEYGVIKAIRNNEPFKPEPLGPMTEQDFVDRLSSRIANVLEDRHLQFADEERWMMKLVEANPHLPLCHEIMKMEDIHTQSLLLLTVVDYASYADQANEGLDLSTISRLYPYDWKCNMLRQKLMRGNHELFALGLIEHKCEDGIANKETYMLTSETKTKLLPAFKPYKITSLISTEGGKDKDLISYKNIEKKELYYNEKEKKQIEKLYSLFSQEKFKTVQDGLEAKGMRKGVAVLFSGGPGTGKTETVRQLARETGRNLFMIDISSIKSKWVGESEKNTRAIFDRYAQQCKISEVKPILFINECDAILGKRLENVEHSADKMMNTMQNILLQALEDLDGIMICTTNLANNLDDAFERRFLMKVNFDKPEANVRAKIWQSMIPELSENDARVLGEQYSFSGGECENVMRKAAIEEIINNVTPTLSFIDTLCKEENVLKKKNIRPVTGFSL